jgi:glucokinase
MDVIGIDVGGTTVKAIRAAVDGTVLARDSVRTPNAPTTLTGAVIALATALRGESTVAVGVVCPGIVVDGIAQFAVNVPWRDEPVRDRVHVALGLPVALEWDVAAAALAESSRVAADDVLFVSLGTGIASAHVVGGVVRRGATGRAGELGHSPVYPDGDECACGQRGCLEAYASAAAIARRYAARTGTSLATIDIAALVGSDPDATAVWDVAVEALGAALATQTMVTDPGVIVLGGGLAEAGDLLVERVRAALAGRLAWRPAPPVTGASLGEAAGMHGAAALAWSLLGPADPLTVPLRRKGSPA